MSKPKMIEPKVWFSGFCGPGKQDWQHQTCKRVAGDLECACACHQKPTRCSCGEVFDGDNLCMPSACQWEDIEPPRTLGTPVDCEMDHSYEIIIESLSGPIGITCSNGCGASWLVTIDALREAWSRPEVTPEVLRRANTDAFRAGWPMPTIYREHEAIHVLCNLLDAALTELRTRS